MSAETGFEQQGLPHEAGRLARWRALGRSWRDHPNPIWIRELRQAARLRRTPVVLAVLTALMTLTVTTICGLLSARSEPATVGTALFHVFFSLSYFGITWAGPGVAATTIASERSGRTWEALLLTGLRPAVIARGKLLASFGYLGLYIVMLSPVATLSFLFGGVTPLEVALALAWLFVFSALAAAFGLSLSSAFSSPTAAVLVTTLVSFVASLVGYLGGGVYLSMRVHELWPEVPSGAPVWLPTAYLRADFGLEYLTLLVLAPLAAVAIVGWFFYEVTVANIAAPGDDTSSGIRRWLLVSLTLGAIASIAPTSGLTTDEWEAATWAIQCQAILLLGSALLVAGEPLGPSPRVRAHWDRNHAGRLRRYLGPGIIQGSSLLLGLGCLTLGAQTAVGVAVEVANRSGAVAIDSLRIVTYGATWASFFVFVAGCTIWIRSRTSTAAAARLLMILALLAGLAGPWVAAMAALLATNGSQAALAFAAPSPFYAARMAEWLGSTSSSRHDLLLHAGAGCSAAWALLGLGLWSLGARRVRQLLADPGAPPRVDRPE